MYQVMNQNSQLKLGGLHCNCEKQFVFVAFSLVLEARGIALVVLSTACAFWVLTIFGGVLVQN